MYEFNEHIVVIGLTDHLLQGLIDFFKWAEVFLITAVVLVLADLRFGVQAAKFRKEVVRRSRAWRRTLSKLFDYLTWVILAYVIGQAFGKPFDIEIIPFIVLLVVCAAEIESIFVNYFASTGKKVKVTLFKGILNKNKDLIDIENKDEETTDHP